MGAGYQQADAAGCDTDAGFRTLAFGLLGLATLPSLLLSLAIWRRLQAPPMAFSTFGSVSALVVNVYAIVEPGGERAADFIQCECPCRPVCAQRTNFARMKASRCAWRSPALSALLPLCAAPSALLSLSREHTHRLRERAPSSHSW